MKPIIELLIQDIEDEKTDIENLSENDFKQVFETYNSLYKRCINLKEEDFDNQEMYQRFMKYVKSSNNSNSMVLGWLEHGVDSASVENFTQLRDILNHFSFLLRNPW